MPYDETGYDLYLVSRAKAPDAPGQLAVIAVGGLDRFGEVVVQHASRVAVAGDDPLLFAQYEAAIVAIAEAQARAARVVNLMVDAPALADCYHRLRKPSSDIEVRLVARLRQAAAGLDKLVVSSNPAPDIPHGVPAHLADFCRSKRLEQDAAVLAP